MSTGPQIESKPTPRLGVPTLDQRRCFRVRVPGPSGEPVELDLTGPITRAIAHELWNQFGGNSVVNWIQAEAVVDHLADVMNGAAPPAVEPKPIDARAQDARPLEAATAPIRAAA